MSKEEKVIMYDSPEAAEQITLTGWISKGKDGRFFYKDEHSARYAGCTHVKCDCGNIMGRGWLKCPECRHKAAVERYNALPFKEWDGKEPVCTWDGDKYFFSIDDLTDYMYDYDGDWRDEDADDKPGLTEIDLLICQPIYYQPIDSETVACDAHEDYEPEEELLQKIKEFNDFLSTLHPHSWTAGKVRTKYILPTT